MDVYVLIVNSARSKPEVQAVFEFEDVAQKAAKTLIDDFNKRDIAAWAQVVKAPLVIKAPGRVARVVKELLKKCEKEK